MVMVTHSYTEKRAKYYRSGFKSYWNTRSLVLSSVSFSQPNANYECYEQSTENIL